MLRNIVQQHASGCVMIVKKNNTGGVDFIGTGFLCHNKGYIATTAHFINLTDKLAIVAPQLVTNFNNVTLDKVVYFDVIIAQFNASVDVALLKITTPPTLSVPDQLFGNEDQIPVGSSVGYFGYPFAGSGLHVLKVSSCVISAKVISKSNVKQFQIDSMVHDGGSGGPLIDVLSGQIIGVINGRFSPIGNNGGIQIGNHKLGADSTISFAVTIGYIKQLLKDEGL